MHISDLHVERLTKREKRLLQLAQETRPDLIAITGDFVNLSYNRDPQTHAQVLLYHSPEPAFEAAAQGIELYLCGHTHGGQVRLPFIGAIFTSSKLGRQFVMGLYRLGCTSLYVSRGVGLEGLSMPRVRFLAPPEVTLVTIMSPEVSNQ